MKNQIKSAFALIAVLGCSLLFGTESQAAIVFKTNGQIKLFISDSSKEKRIEKDRFEIQYSPLKGGVCKIIIRDWFRSKQFPCEVAEGAKFPYLSLGGPLLKGVQLRVTEQTVSDIGSFMIAHGKKKLRNRANALSTALVSQSEATGWDIQNSQFSADYNSNCSTNSEGERSCNVNVEFKAGHEDRSSTDGQSLRLELAVRSSTEI